MTCENFQKNVWRHEEFEQLFEENSRWLFNYLFSLLRDFTDVEDALQETGRICWQKLDQYDRSMPFRTWAGKIAYFVAMKIFDYRKKRNVLCTEQFFEDISSEAIIIADQLDNRSEALKRCLERLPEKDRFFN